MEKKNGSITVKVGNGTYIVNMMAAEDAKGTFENKVRSTYEEGCAGYADQFKLYEHISK